MWQILYLAPHNKILFTAVAGDQMRKSPKSSFTEVSISAFPDGVDTDMI
jgi:hypothetical protein